MNKLKIATLVLQYALLPDKATDFIEANQLEDRVKCDDNLLFLFESDWQNYFKDTDNPTQEEWELMYLEYPQLRGREE